jgi:hypothetical protein
MTTRRSTTTAQVRHICSGCFRTNMRKSTRPAAALLGCGCSKKKK